MLTAYPTAHGPTSPFSAGDCTWIDLLNPTNAETARVESALRIKLPSREELSEIESSSRISEKDGLLLLSMPVVANAHDLDEDPSPVGFALSQKVLITIRYTQLRSFETV